MVKDTLPKKRKRGRPARDDKDGIKDLVENDNYNNNNNTLNFQNSDELDGYGFKPKKNDNRKKNTTKIDKNNSISILKKFSNDLYENSALNTENPFFNNNPFTIHKASFNLKDKFLYLYGYNQDVLNKVLKTRNDWNYNIFHLNNKIIKNLNINDLQENTIFFKKLNQFLLKFEEFDKLFPLHNKLNLNFNSDENNILLQPGAASYFPIIKSSNIRQGFVLNTGGLPISSSWFTEPIEFNQNFSPSQYLAISLSNKFDITNQSLSLFNEPKNSLKEEYGGLHIYTLNSENFQLSLIKSYIFQFGIMFSLKWLPWKNKSDPNIIGIVVGICTDGTIRFLKIPKHTSKDPEFILIKEASFTIAIPETKITAFDFISNKSIIAGTSDGCILEYNLETKSPSFVHPLLTHHITSITTNYSDYYFDHDPSFSSSGEYQLSNKIIFVGSLDTNIIVDLNDLRNLISFPSKNKTFLSQSCYSPRLDTFAINEGSQLTKIFTKRDSAYCQNILKSEGTTSALASSRLHPMIINGSSDGEANMCNAIGRIISTKKNALSSNFPTVRLFKLEYSSKLDKYRLVTNHATNTVSLKELGLNFQFHPPQICVNSVAWNENTTHPNWYCATTCSGLVIIESLMSAETINS
ncbi:hypothetical protein PACTADRAFT_82278 [Pachysolen tannophilus NRRL Y-2460]|uniref:Uncharacterized protein n=1 Tax=Pachysolen tannophilus NRRL Y-2460 TaxID=669874 RepID=A0A1E4TPY9_PACTA|nr:hypothetical protein PACTADRAFT_82278 [Pachysolen tannophilus NRRL Y-2460]